MLGAEIQHLLRLAESADDRAGELTPPEQQTADRERQRRRRCSHKRHRAIEFEQIEISIYVVFGGNCVEDEVEGAEMLSHLRFVFRDHNLVRTQALGVFRFLRRSCKQHDVGAESVGKFHSHVPEAAESYDSYLLAFFHVPVTERGICGDPCAKQRRGRCRIQLFRYAQHKRFVDHDAVGISAVSYATKMFIFRVVGKGWHTVAELFVARAAVRAGAVGIDQTAHGGEISRFEFLDGGAGFHDSTNDFMARHAGIHSRHHVFPFIAYLMKIGVADSAVQNLDLHIVGSGLTALDGGRSKPRSGALRCVGLCRISFCGFLRTFFVSNDRRGCLTHNCMISLLLLDELPYTWLQIIEAQDNNSISAYDRRLNESEELGMCFSAAANFVGSGVLATVGVATLIKVKHRRELLFASLPTLFAIHQFIEGFVWLGLDGMLSPKVTHNMGAAFMLYAQGLLPFLLPLSVLLFEPNGKSRRRMVPFLVLGSMTTLFILWALTAYPTEIFVKGNSIVYINQATNNITVAIFYVIATCGSLLFSKVKDMVIFGWANLAILLTVMAFKRYAFTSLWCAYAAVASVIILAYFWKSSGTRPFRYAV